MTGITVAQRVEVIRRAGDRCEYCQLSQVGQEAAFHIDHVVPRAADGPTAIENLALACVSCSLQKGAKEVALDPVTNVQVPLFHPRTQVWEEHFRWELEWVVALTPTGRATASALALNRLFILRIRREEILRGRHPPAPSSTG
jgi:hypothetical protein